MERINAASCLKDLGFLSQRTVLENFIEQAADVISEQYITSDNL
jgi:hypothetical protein